MINYGKMNFKRAYVELEEIENERRDRLHKTLSYHIGVVVGCVVFYFKERCARFLEGYRDES